MKELSRTCARCSPGSAPSTLTGVLNRRGLKSMTLFDVWPMRPEQPAMVGIAFTMRFIPSREDKDGPTSTNRSMVQPQAMEECPPGHVLMIDLARRFARGVGRRPLHRPAEGTRRGGRRHRRRLSRHQRRVQDRPAGAVTAGRPRYGGAMKFGLFLRVLVVVAAVLLADDGRRPVRRGHRHRARRDAGRGVLWWPIPAWAASTALLSWGCTWSTPPTLHRARCTDGSSRPGSSSCWPCGGSPQDDGPPLHPAVGALPAIFGGPGRRGRRRRGGGGRVAGPQPPGGGGEGWPSSSRRPSRSAPRTPFSKSGPGSPANSTTWSPTTCR